MSRSSTASSQDLQSLYRTKLLVFYEHLEKMRHQTLVAYFIASVISVLVFMILHRWIGFDSKDAREAVVTLTTLVVTACFYTAKIKFQDPYRNYFKSNVSQKVFDLVAPGLRYSPSSRVDQGLFFASRLFRNRIDLYHGDDHFTGMVGKTRVEFSEVHSQYKVRTRRGHRYVTSFKGIFFCADFNKHVSGETYVLPDYAERGLGVVGRMIQNANPNRHAPELIRLENPDFEKHFVVHGTSQTEARYCLTPDMMLRLLNLQKRFGTKLYVSILGSRINLALAFRGDLFEAPLWSPALKFQNIQKMATLLDDLLGIVHELDLNTRIWTKKAA